MYYMPMKKIYNSICLFGLLFACFNSLKAQDFNKSIPEESLSKIQEILLNDLSQGEKPIKSLIFLLSDEERNEMISKLSILVDSNSLNAFGNLDQVLKSEAITYIHGNRSLFETVEYIGMEESNYYGYNLFSFHYKITFKDKNTPDTKIRVFFTKINDDYKMLFIYFNNLNF